jgi:hypothetical protein
VIDGWRVSNQSKDCKRKSWRFHLIR